MSKTTAVATAASSLMYFEALSRNEYFPLLKMINGNKLCLKQAVSKAMFVLL